MCSSHSHMSGPFEVCSLAGLVNFLNLVFAIVSSICSVVFGGATATGGNSGRFGGSSLDWKASGARRNIISRQPAIAAAKVSTQLVTAVLMRAVNVLQQPAHGRQTGDVQPFRPPTVARLGGLEESHARKSNPPPAVCQKRRWRPPRRGRCSLIRERPRHSERPRRFRSD